MGRAGRHQSAIELAAAAAGGSGGRHKCVCRSPVCCVPDMTMLASVNLSLQAQPAVRAAVTRVAVRPAHRRVGLPGHAHVQAARRPLRQPQASSGGQREPPPDPTAAARSLVSSPLYRWWLQGAVALVVFMLVDAGFSGDWVRIGAITKEQEALARQACLLFLSVF